MMRNDMISAYLKAYIATSAHDTGTGHYYARTCHVEERERKRERERERER